jgi:hypothetical protein
MRYAYAELRNALGEVMLIVQLRDDDLRCACACCSRGCAGAAMVNDRGDSLEQRLLADRPRKPARFLVLGSASVDLLNQGSETAKVRAIAAVSLLSELESIKGSR